MMYYTPPPPAEGMPASDCIVREDGAWIPNDPSNRDWAEYQTWLGEGNTAQPYSAWVPPTPPASGSA